MPEKDKLARFRSTEGTDKIGWTSLWCGVVSTVGMLALLTIPLPISDGTGMVIGFGGLGLAAVGLGIWALIRGHYDPDATKGTAVTGIVFGSCVTALLIAMFWFAMMYSYVD